MSVQAPSVHEDHPPDVGETAASMARMYAAGVPAVFRPSAALFSAQEVFGWIAAVHPAAVENTARQKLEALRHSWGVGEGVLPPEADPGRPAEMYREGGVLLDAARHLPRAGEDFATWVPRVRGALGGPFGMQAPGLECASWAAHHRLTGLLAPVLRITGPRTFRYNAFGGDYARTPFGFHVDPHQEAVFQYVLVGRRRASFWDALSLGDADVQWLEDGDPSTKPAVAPDFVFDLEPGDLVFWPGNYAHGMEPRGPSLGLSMVVDRASPRTRQEVVTTLETRTAGGRCAMPAIDEHVRVGPGQTLVRAAVHPLAYERFDDVLIIGVCGRTLDWPDPGSTPAAMRLVDRLCAEQVVVVDTLIADVGDETLPAAMICEVLSVLAGLGYFAG